MAEVASRSTYELYVSYDPDTDDLAASLDFLSKVVSNQSKADKIMARGMGEGLSTKIVLEDIKKSSIRLFIDNVIRETGEDQIRDKGVRAIWHQFLIESRKVYLEYASKHHTLEKRQDLKDIKQKVVKIAQDNKINPIPLEGLSDEQIAKCLADYSVPSGLGENQEFKAVCMGKEYILTKFKITAEQITDILNDESQTLKDQTVYLKPKTAVYEGDGMWDFHIANVPGTYKGKILHEDWLYNFQHGNLDSSEYPFPGKVLEVRADIIVKFDEANFRKGIVFHIHEVLGLRSNNDIKQISFDDILKIASPANDGEAEE